MTRSHAGITAGLFSDVGKHRSGELSLVWHWLSPFHLLTQRAFLAAPAPAWHLSVHELTELNA
ncbi:MULTISPECIES: hypothetical protein [Alcanivorax]|uniref:hypothetical protein n=1 Tax=Alcanivorax TaxID=59753 RepID=UPI0002DC51B0|nr:MULTISPECIES: hypothetical protein [Alcanivorax]